MERKVYKKTVNYDKKAGNHRINEEGSSNKSKITNTSFNDELRVVIKVKSKENNDINQKTNQLAMGDSKKKKPEKPRNTAIINVKRTAQSNNDRKITEENNAKTLDMLMRKKLRDRYTFKLQTPDANDSLNISDEANKKVSKHEKNIDMQRNDKPQKTDSKNNNREDKTNSKEDTNKEKEKPAESSEDSGITVNINPIGKKERHRKPIIKTITSKNDATRIYKAVTFVDNEQRKRSALEISIPSDAFKRSRTRFSPMKKIKSPVYAKRSTQSRNSTDKKVDNSAISSPELSIAGSPTQTEVAKWVPASIDQLTKPYYDAWVDTTVAAVFREEIDDTQKQLILDSIKKTIREKELQRTNSLDLTYENLRDESYMGRIKIRQREHKHKKAHAAAV